ncbi:hypothetical protein, partial [Clavibacter michiganensis]|uniref:hypothetical protein n=1 Tax=Clavibacter michiganensis TaxID=28447 RepID=UPI00293028C2
CGVGRTCGGLDRAGVGRARRASPSAPPRRAFGQAGVRRDMDPDGETGAMPGRLGGPAEDLGDAPAKRRIAEFAAMGWDQSVVPHPQDLSAVQGPQLDRAACYGPEAA